ncbi:MAG: hypothetical protein KAG66_13125, partial [Methylococcales bacterium]|nr:hypothetical protein [Methylococcales bacterium]
QTIPITGVAQGLQYFENQGLNKENETPAIAVCSIGDGAMTEGEVAEAMQMAALHQYPILYLVQDNGWGISAQAHEMYAQHAADFAKGFSGIETRDIDGSDFLLSYACLEEVIDCMRRERRPFLVRARVPLLAHHTSGVRSEWYRDDYEEAGEKDPLVSLHERLLEIGIRKDVLKELEDKSYKQVAADFQKAAEAADPDPEDLFTHIYAPTPDFCLTEQGERSPEGANQIIMVDAALHAVKNILEEHPEALLYGQDVGGKLGGVFREAALLADKYGDQRVFNTPIQEAYIIGSTVGMSAVGCKPIVEIHLGDYIWPGLNQLFCEVSRSCYLSHGKWPVQSLIRVPIGAYGSGGPFHSSSI